ncbi:efflux transporter outer membrane subunit [Achromobacter pestifer]|uniref:Efflux transporter outer membrane subunit n=1 Tax=Achromobacter pestifer TaxID=1353889 RepID=A0A7D4DYI9_9BURK|nr:efflux transporter outer membrane subunit [Achromobacter pestifer]QKH36968.1 efflux transporter outer membrane subunit [Achromobacter pestifer]
MTPRRLINAALAGTLSALTGCAVGPDFQAPQAQLPPQWRMPDASAAGSVPVPQDVNTSWWDSFGDPTLSALIAEATAANLDIRIAHERLLQSRSALRVAEADGLPGIGAGASYKRGQNSEAGLADPSGRGGKSSFNLWQASVDASWELDLWGRVRREVEQAGAQSQAALEAQRGVVLAIRAETARNYILLRGAQNQLDVLRQTLANAERNLALTRLRQREGVATELDVSQADAQAASIEAGVPPLALRIEQLMNALALLLEQPPGALQQRLAAVGPIPGGPLQVPVGLPSELAERRPDIRRAQANLHAAVAAIGMAEGDFYPRITLSGNLGLQALQLRDLDTDNAGIFGVGPALQIPIFQGGRLRGRLRLRESQAQEAALLYQKTVLNAWHEVDNAMTAYQAQQLTRASLERASESARQALLNAQRQYAAGASDFVNVLSAQNAVLASDQARVTTQATVSLVLVDLYRSLGGGWEPPAAGLSPAAAPQ